MRLSRSIVIVVLAALAGVYVLAGAVGAVFVFAAQAVYTLRSRSPWLLAVQAGLVYTLTLGFGTSVGVLGFLGGSLLVTRLWALAPLVAFSAAVIDYARHGDAAATLGSTITTVLGTLVVYGLTRLVDRVDEMHATRPALAVAAVAEERLRITAELSDGLGRGLAAIIVGARRALAAPGTAAEVLGEVTATARRSLADARAAAGSYRAMSLGPELTTARAMLAAAGIEVEVRSGHAEPLGPAGTLLATVLREAVTDVVRRATAGLCLIETSESAGVVRLRVTDDGRRTAEAGTGLTRQVEAAGGTLTTGLGPDGRYVLEAALPAPSRTAPPEQDERYAYAVSVATLAAVLVGFSVKALLEIPANLRLPATAVLAVIVVMQIRSVTGRHPKALAVMAFLTYAPIPVFGVVWLGATGFLAGPLLLALRWRVAWPLSVAVMASVAVIEPFYGLPAAVTVNHTMSTLVTGLVVYSLERLAQLVKELQAARESLARSAVVGERLRAARDLHDLLGHSLAAILLKCELARRLDPGRAAAELRDVIAMCERAEADLRSVSGDRHDLSLTAEAESARSVLAAAHVSVTVELAHPPLPAEVETVLSAVLREAVTNVLRHSAARHCTISTTSADGLVRLRVRNDGVEDGTRPRRGSSGMGNLTTRLAALDGRLTTTAGDGWFELDAGSPVPLAVGNV